MNDIQTVSNLDFFSFFFVLHFNDMFHEEVKLLQSPGQARRFSLRSHCRLPDVVLSQGTSDVTNTDISGN